MKEPIWIEIDKKNLQNNIKTLRQAVGERVILTPCIKSNAYGHGLFGVADILCRSGADWLAVNSLFEAVELRRKGIKKPIIVLGYVLLSELREIINNDLKILVYNLETAQKLSELAKQQDKIVDVHIKVDTGMGRQGVLVEEAEEFIRKLLGFGGLNLEGIATHYANSNEPENPAYFNKQLDRFIALLKDLQLKNIRPKIAHSANSAATFLKKEAWFDLVRPGLSVYGYYSSKATREECLKKNLILKPVLTLKTKVAMVKTLKKGEGVGYGSMHITDKETTVAILPIGYYDGLDRKLSNKGEALIKGQRAKILGRVCMNMIIVDITHLKGVKLEDEAVLLGRQGDGEITVEELAEKSDTINYEVTARLRESIKRYYN